MCFLDAALHLYGRHELGRNRITSSIKTFMTVGTTFSIIETVMEKALVKPY